MNSVVYINGKFFDGETASIPVFDRGFLYGDSIYEVTMTQKKVPLFLDEHLERLWYSGQKMGMPPFLSKGQIESIISQGIHKLGVDRQYIRIIVTRGEGEIGLDPNLAKDQNTVIIFRELKEHPAKWYEKGVSMMIPGILRNPVESVDPNIKSGNYLNNVMAISEAKRADVYDAIMLNQDGQVTESSTSNIWIYADGIYKTPPIRAGLLGGITRKVLLEMCKTKDLKAIEANFTPDEMKSAAECFLTSSTREIVPIVEIDGDRIGQGIPGEATKQLHTLYKSHVKERHKL